MSDYNNQIAITAVDETSSGVKSAEKRLSQIPRVISTGIYVGTNAAEAEKEVKAVFHRIKSHSSAASIAVNLRGNAGAQASRLLGILSQLPATLSFSTSFDGGKLMSGIRDMVSSGKTAESVLAHLRKQYEELRASGGKKNGFATRQLGDMMKAAEGYLQYEKRLIDQHNKLGDLRAKGEAIKSKEMRDAFFQSSAYRSLVEEQKKQERALAFGSTAAMYGSKNVGAVDFTRLYQEALRMIPKGSVDYQGKYGVKDAAGLHNAQKRYDGLRRDFNKEVESLFAGGKIGAGQIKKFYEQIAKLSSTLSEQMRKIENKNARHNGNLRNNVELYNLRDLHTVAGRLMAINREIGVNSKKYGAEYAAAVNAPWMNLRKHILDQLNNGGAAMLRPLARESQMGATRAAVGNIIQERGLSGVAQQYRDFASQARAAEGYISKLQRQLDSGRLDSRFAESIANIRSAIVGLNSSMTDGRGLSVTKQRFEHLRGLVEQTKMEVSDSRGWAKLNERGMSMLHDLKRKETELQAKLLSGGEREGASAGINTLNGAIASLSAALKSLDYSQLERTIAAAKQAMKEANSELRIGHALASGDKRKQKENEKQLREITRQRNQISSLFNEYHRLPYRNMNKDLAGRIYESLNSAKSLNWEGNIHDAKQRLVEVKQLLAEYKALSREIANAKKMMTSLRGQRNEISEKLSAGKLGEDAKYWLRALEKGANVLSQAVRSGDVAAIKGVMHEVERTRSSIASSMRVDQTKRAAIARAEAEGARTAQEALTRAAQRYSRELSGINVQTLEHQGLLSQLGQEMAAAYSVYQLRQFLTNLVDIGGQFEYQRRAIANILGDTAKANTLFNQIKNLAIKSPFSTLELDSYAKQLSAFDIEYNELFEKLSKLADISAGTGADMSRIILAYGHVKAEGFLTGMQRRQFSNANINIVGALADLYSQREGKPVSRRDIYRRISEKEVSAEDLDKVLMAMAEPGGKFYQMQEAMAGTTKALWKNAGDAINHMYMDLEQELRGPLQAAAKAFIWLTTEVKNLIPNIYALGGLIAALTTARALQNAGTGQTMAWYRKNEALLNRGDVRNVGNLGKVITPSAQYNRVNTYQNALNSRMISKNDVAELVYTGRMKAVDAAELTTGKGKNKISLFSAEELKKLDSIPTKFKAMNAALTPLHFGIRRLGLSIRAAGIAMKGFMASMLPMLGITLAFEGITYFWNKTEDEAKEATERIKEQTDGLKALKEEMANYEGVDLSKMSDTELIGLTEDMLETIKDDFAGLRGEAAKFFKTDQEGNYLLTPLQRAEGLLKLLKEARNMQEYYVKNYIDASGVMNDVMTDKWLNGEALNNINSSRENIDKKMSEAVTEITSHQQAFAPIFRSLENANKQFANDLRDIGAKNEDGSYNLKSLVEVLTINKEAQNQLVSLINQSGNIGLLKHLGSLFAAGNSANTMLHNLNGALEKFKKEMQNNGAFAGKTADEIDRMTKIGFPVWLENNNVALSRSLDLLSQFRLGIKEIGDIFENLGDQNEKDLSTHAKKWFTSPLRQRKVNIKLPEVDASDYETIQHFRKQLKEAKDRYDTLKNVRHENSKGEAQRAKDEIDAIEEWLRIAGIPKELDKKSDKELSRWKKQLDAIENFRTAFEKLRDAKSELTQSDAEILNVMKAKDEFKSVLAGLSAAGIKAEEIIDLKGFSNVISSHIKKGIPRGKYVDKDGRTAALADAAGKLQDVNIKLSNESIEREAKRAKAIFERIVKKWDIYIDVKKITGDGELAEKVATTPIYLDDEATALMKNEILSSFGQLGDAALQNALDAEYAKRKEDYNRRYTNGDAATRSAMLLNAPVEYSVEDLKAFRVPLEHLSEAFKDGSLKDSLTTLYERMAKVGDDVRKSIVDAITELASANQRIAALEQEKEKALAALSLIGKDADKGGYAALAEMSPNDVSKRFGGNVLLGNVVVTAAKNGVSDADGLRAIVEKYFNDKLLTERGNAFKENSSTQLALRNIEDMTRKMMEQTYGKVQKIVEAVNADSVKVYDEKTGELKGYKFGKNADGEFTRFVSSDVWERLVEQLGKLAEKLDVPWNEPSKQHGFLGKAWEFINGKDATDKDGNVIRDENGNPQKWSWKDFLPSLKDGIADLKSAFDDLGALSEKFEGLEGVGDAIGIASASLTAAQGLMSGNPVTMVSSLIGLVGSLADIHDKRLNRKIEESKRGLSEMQWRYEQIQGDISRGFGQQNAYHQESIDSLDAQIAAVEKQRKLEEDKKKSDKDALQAYSHELTELRRKRAQYAKELAKNIYDLDFKSLSNELGDAIWQAFQNGEDAALAWEKKVGDIIRNLTNKMLAMNILQPKFEALEEKYFGKMDRDGKVLSEGLINRDATNIQEMLPKLIDDVHAIGESPVFTAYSNALSTLNSKYPVSSNSGTSSNLGRLTSNITEETGSLIASYTNAIRADVSVFKTIANHQLKTLNQIAENTNRNAAAAAEIKDILNAVTSGTKKFHI